VYRIESVKAEAGHRDAATTRGYQDQRLIDVSITRRLSRGTRSAKGGEAPAPKQNR
jgi:hypothetical protein